MLTRRTFLTTITAAPLAAFCKTEPMRPYEPHITSRVVLKNRTVLEFLHSGRQMHGDVIDAINFLMDAHAKKAHLTDVLYALPPGTLG